MNRPVPGLPIEAQPEGAVIRMLAYGEARGEGPMGIIAVLWVVKNRALKKDTTLKHEALRPLQFSCFNADDPNREKLLTAWKRDPDAWRVVDALATVFETAEMIDPTHGSCCYYVEKMPNPPKWGRGHKDWKETVVLGRHVFGNCPPWT